MSDLLGMSYYDACYTWIVEPFHIDAFIDLTGCNYTSPPDHRVSVTGSFSDSVFTQNTAPCVFLANAAG